jgi:hypothetical protein
VALVVAAVLILAALVLETHQVFHQVKEITVELVVLMVKPEAAEVLTDLVEILLLVVVEVVEHLQ